jgi:hypothetical protein
MKTIYKYPLETIDHQKVEMPKGSEILTVQIQNGVPMLWALVDDEILEVEIKLIDTHGTGHNVTDAPKKYISTYQMLQGRLIFHVFERIGV